MGMATPYTSRLFRRRLQIGVESFRYRKVSISKRTGLGLGLYGCGLFSWKDLVGTRLGQKVGTKRGSEVAMSGQRGRPVASTLLALIASLVYALRNSSLLWACLTRARECGDVACSTAAVAARLRSFARKMHGTLWR